MKLQGNKQVVISKNWDSILIKSQVAGTGQKLPVRSLRTVRNSLGSGHQRKGLFGTVSAEQALAFTIVGVAGDEYYIEALESGAKDEFVRAVNALLDLYARFPTKVPPPAEQLGSA